MYAIIVSGGKQYRVQKDDVIKVELMEAEVGSTVELSVLMLNKDGEVLVADDVKSAVVKAEVVSHGKGRKLNIFTYKAKKNIRKRQGHRQPYTELKILDIVG